ncbi:MAG: hypothetical protein HY651_10510 [Acidobacteria bacterium]|nr:hypothetical protein [Acidobacteriota bacterium]
MAVDGNIYNLAYQKPYRLILSSKECAYAGSIWTVEAILAADHQGTLISAECTGERDDFDLAAVLLVSRYLRLISDEAFSVAYSMFTTAYTKSHSLAEFMSEADKLNLSSYDQFGRQGQCLEIVRTPSEEAIDVRAGIECYLTYKVGGNAELVFEVEREQSSKEIKINSIQRE